MVIPLACLLVGACGGEPEPGITAGVDGCSRCNMVIDRVNESCGWVLGGQFVPFDSPGCLLAGFDELRKSGQGLPAAIYFADYDNGLFNLAESTTFLLTEHVTTVMNGHVICFATAGRATAFRQHEDEIVTDWMGYRTARGEPDVVIDTVFGPRGMEPEVVGANKGELVLWRATGAGLDEDLMWAIAGYPEVGPVTVPADGNPVELRFFASRPGAGFPIEDAAGGQALGMLKVAGAHTTDEEAM